MSGDQRDTLSGLAPDAALSENTALNQELQPKLLCRAGDGSLQLPRVL